MITIKTAEEIKKLRKGGRILASILKTVAEEVRPGVSAATLDALAQKLMVDAGGRPSFLNYTPDGAKRPYPASLCISINDEIVHGIPNEEPKIIQPGDVVTLDGGFIYEGLFTDHAITIPVGKIDKKVKELMKATKEALQAGIDAARPGNHIGDIGYAVSAVARKRGFCVIQHLAGHGVGYAVHEDPYVPNYGEQGQGDEIVPGMVLAIEPMFGLGASGIKLAKDGYTYITTDGSIAVQYEHTVAITEKGPVILTK
jgi:methionyl aminopeptidase